MSGRCQPWEGSCHSKLVDSRSICSAKLYGDCEFGTKNIEDGVVEFVLRYTSNQKVVRPMFSTRIKDVKSNRRLLRRLCLTKVDKNRPFVTPISGVKFEVELLEERPTTLTSSSGSVDVMKIQPFAKLNAAKVSKPIERIPLRLLDDDGINLPKELNPRFYIRIYAVGNIETIKKVRLNCLFYVDYAGDIQNESETLVDTNTLAPGTSETRFGGI